MVNLELLTQKVKTSLAKAQARFEKSKRYKETDDEKYSAFRHGQSWGEIRAYNNILSIIGQCKEKEDDDSGEIE